MRRVVYVEGDLAEHPRVRRILQRLGSGSGAPRVIECGHYGEVFNVAGQDFRLQKRRPALILARKENRFVLPTPEGYGVGGARNRYFSHLLNCPYDCSYCFLQGMFRSAHQVLFVNFEDFQSAIDRELEAAPADSMAPGRPARRPERETERRSTQQADEPAARPSTWFFSGYDCDSLAFEGVSGFVEEFVPFFGERPGARLELRTKSAAIGPLLTQRPADNVVVAYSLSPGSVARRFERGAASTERRIEALRRLAKAGWRVGLRFDPVLPGVAALEDYGELFREVFAAVPEEAVHSVSLGAFRLPASFHRRMARRTPLDPILATADTKVDGMVSAAPEVAEPFLEAVTSSLLEHVPEEKVFPLS